MITKAVGQSTSTNEPTLRYCVGCRLESEIGTGSLESDKCPDSQSKEIDKLWKSSAITATVEVNPRNSDSGLGEASSDGIKQRRNKRCSCAKTRVARNLTAYKDDSEKITSPWPVL